jgi:hypothetical protein
MFEPIEMKARAIHKRRFPDNCFFFHQLTTRSGEVRLYPKDCTTLRCEQSHLFSFKPM